MIWRDFEKTLKGHQYGYLMKGLGSKNMVFIFFIFLHFVNINKENTLYGSFGRLRVKSFETWWMSSLNPNTQS